MPNRARLKRAILEVVENQVRDNQPPEARQALERLLAAGYSRQEAVEMLGSVVASEIWHIGHENEPYNAERYKAAINALG